MSRLRSTLGLTALAVGVACSGRDTVIGPDANRASTLAIAPGQADANGVVTGTIVGDRIVAAAEEHVAGATVEVYREARDSTSETGPVNVTRTRVGSVVSAANGTFTLTNVPNGYYRLDVTPPAGSPYKPASSGTVSFASQGTGSAIVYLQSR